MAAAEQAGVDELVCLGDYLEANVPRRLHDPDRYWPLPAVVDPDPSLWGRLAAVRRIRGNQEERIRELLRPEQTPPELAAILDAPAREQLHGVLALHGHQIRWTLAGGPTGYPSAAAELLLPVAADVPRRPVVVVGHTHQSAVFEIHWSVAMSGSVEPRVRVVAGQPGAALPVPSDTGPSDAVRRTLVVNVGSAHGRTQSWLYYDTDRGEICFRTIARARKESERAR